MLDYTYALAAKFLPVQQSTDSGEPTSCKPPDTHALLVGLARAPAAEHRPSTNQGVRLRFTIAKLAQNAYPMYVSLSCTWYPWSACAGACCAAHAVRRRAWCSSCERGPGAADCLPAAGRAELTPKRKLLSILII